VWADHIGLQGEGMGTLFLLAADLSNQRESSILQDVSSVDSIFQSPNLIGFPLAASGMGSGYKLDLVIVRRSGFQRLFRALYFLFSSSRVEDALADA
jgi:hypothetical protein